MIRAIAVVTPLFLLLAGSLLDGSSLESAGSRTLPVDLSAGRTWLVSVEQQGIDVTVEIAGPDGTRLTAVDAPFDRQGVETLVVTPAAGGTHGITVKAREAGAPAGRFSIRVEELTDPRRAEAASAASRAGERYLEGTTEAWRQARAGYSAVAGLWEALGDTREQARALYAAAVLARLTGDTQQALETGQRVLPLWQALPERLWEAATRNEIGLDLWLLGRMDEARASFETALAIQKEIGDRYGEAVSLSNLCASDLPRGRLREALACYEEALPRLREVRAATLQGSALTSSGRALDILGEPEQALLRYQEALALLRSVGDRTGEARALNNIAVLHREMGEFRDALASYGQALEVVTALQDRRWQARVLHNLGAVYQDLGEPRQALPRYEQALALWRATGDREGEASTLTNLGQVHSLLEDPRRALSFHEQALALQRSIGDRRGMGDHAKPGRPRAGGAGRSGRRAGLLRGGAGRASRRRRRPVRGQDPARARRDPGPARTDGGGPGQLRSGAGPRPESPHPGDRGCNALLAGPGGARDRRGRGAHRGSPRPCRGGGCRGGGSAHPHRRSGPALLLRRHPS